jgi:plastocyanin domain-containing protein
MSFRRYLLYPILGALCVAPQGCKKDAQGPGPGRATQGSPPKAEPKATPTPLAYAPRIEVAVTEEGFVPSKIPARAGQPLTMAITRKTDRTCATDIVFHGQEGKTPLPLNQMVEVTYTPKQSGVIHFGCAMGMMIGGVLEVAD